MDEEDTNLDAPEGTDDEAQAPEAPEPEAPAPEAPAPEAPAPDEPEIAPVVHEVDLADEEGFPTSDPVAAPPHTLTRRVSHSPSVRYWYAGSAETLHPVLGFIKPGENRFTSTDADTVGAVEACVEAGLLRVR